MKAVLRHKTQWEEENWHRLLASAHYLQKNIKWIFCRLLILSSITLFIVYKLIYGIGFVLKLLLFTHPFALHSHEKVTSSHD